MTSRVELATQRKVLEGLKKYTHGNLSSIEFVSSNIIRVNHRHFYYQVEGDIVHIKPISYSRPLKKETRKLRSNHGKATVLDGTLPFFKMAFLTIGLTVSISVAEQERNVSLEDLTPYQVEMDVPTETMSAREWPSESETVTNSLESQEVISLSLDEMDEAGFAKKDETIRLFGSAIFSYAERYGIDANLMVALFTQERSNDPNDIGYANVGQLTNALCGEKIVVPVYQNGEVVKQDAFFLLPPCYDDYPLEDLETMGTFPKFSAAERQVITEAISLKKEGFTILKIGDVKKNSELNIEISCAYFGYLKEKKQDLIPALASYNFGYPTASRFTNEEMVRGEVFGVDDPLYITHVLRYLTNEELSNGLVIFYNTPEGVKECHYSFEVLYEKNSHTL